MTTPTEQADRIKGLVEELRKWVNDGYGGETSAGLIERSAEALQALQTRVGELEAIQTALAKRAYVMSGPHLSGHRVVIGFEARDDAWAAHTAIAPLTHPVEPRQ